MTVAVAIQAAAKNVARLHLENLDFRFVVSELGSEAWSKDELAEIHRLAITATPAIN